MKNSVFILVSHVMFQFPVTLNECRPKAGMELYLHVIKQQPVYPRPDDSNSRKLAFYNLLHCSEGYAILSAKPMPKVGPHTQSNRGQD
jgi:hypothetical protein